MSNSHPDLNKVKENFIAVAETLLNAMKRFKGELQRLMDLYTKKYSHEAYKQAAGQLLKGNMLHPDKIQLPTEMKYQTQSSLNNLLDATYNIKPKNQSEKNPDNNNPPQLKL